MKLKNRIQFGLDETRILILGCQLLVGFQFRSFFEPGYERLAPSLQLLKFAVLLALMLAFALMVTPSAFHRIAEQGEDTRRFDRLITRLMWPALLPLVLAVAAEIFVSAQKVVGFAGGLALAALSGLWSLGLIFGFVAVARKRLRREEDMSNDDGKTEIKDKLRHVLTEARLVIPGVQALIGFQLALFLMDGFETLPETSKYLHLASLMLIALTLALLLTPAAYHRVAERGEATEHMHKIGSRFVLLATVPLAIALALDFYVVSEKVLRSTTQAALAAAALLAVLAGLWFLYPAMARNKARA